MNIDAPREKTPMTPTDAQHMPGELEVRQAGPPCATDREEDCLIFSRDDDGTLRHIAETFQYQNDNHHARDGTSPANARRLAHCWNCHDELVAVAESQLDLIDQLELLGCLDDSMDDFDRIAEYREEALAAYAKAKRKTE